MAGLRSWIAFGSSLSLLAVCVPLLAQESCTITVRPGESIQAAIDAAPEGAVICLAAGEWGENVTIKKSLTLRAAHTEPEPQVVIRSARDDSPAIIIDSDLPIAVTIRGIKITDAVGISVHGKATSVIENNTISETSSGIEMFDSSPATIEGNTIRDSGSGIRMWDSSQATIANNTISSNVLGIDMLSGSSQATIEGNTISGNWWDGIWMRDSSQATITGNVIRDNRSYGVSLHEGPCFDTAQVFTGYVTGGGNTSEGNVRGDYCPEDLAFLFTEEGGELDRRQ